MISYKHVLDWNDQVLEIASSMWGLIEHNDENIQSALDKLIEAHRYIEAELKLREVKNG